MILPHTYAMILALMIVSALCWGSWANTFKLAGKWRFELYYFDFAFGLLLLALLYAFTVGNLGYDGFGFMDSAMNAGKRQWMFGIAAGVVFNIGNMLLLAAISSAGMALAIPVGLGTALAVGALLDIAGKSGGNAAFLFAGCVLAAAAAAADSVAYRALRRQRHEELAKAGKAVSTKRPTDLKEIVLALIGGVMLGSFAPLLRMATESDAGLGPYALCVFFGAGVLFSTFVLGVFLLNLSLEAETIGIADYSKGTAKQHLLGLAGGGLWCTGALASFVAIYSNAPGATGGLPAEAAPVSSALAFAAPQAAAVIGGLWGLLLWREYKGGDTKVKALAAATLVLFAGGVAMVALAPKFAVGS
jgi:glucose uptake protein